MIKYPSIDQFRNAIATVQKLSHKQHARRREDGSIIEGQQRTWKFPPVVFRGTVKLHGTNAAVVIEDGKVRYQSRNRVLTPIDDNAGFAGWASQHESLWKEVAAPFGNIVVFGEWCGRGIQKGVALSELDPMFVVFEAWKIDGGFIKIDQLSPLPEQTFRATDFPNWQLEIDFENPQLVQNRLVEITMAVEAECPVGKAFGVSGIGEGVVWSADIGDERVRFKVKGEKHSTHRVRTLAAITAEDPGTLAQFVEDALTPARLQQGLDWLTEQGLPHTVQSTGDYVRWIVGDVVKEESDTMAAGGLDVAIVKKRIGTATALRFKSQVWAEAA
ncbi:RNA ligase family protein [Agrobacterium pusense]|uniref:RNA ligase family protein n=1 Tax=Agrobacterium pusense TaxID=648995 RepID=UPI002F3EB00D